MGIYKMMGTNNKKGISRKCGNKRYKSGILAVAIALVMGLSMAMPAAAAELPYQDPAGHGASVESGGTPGGDSGLGGENGTGGGSEAGSGSGTESGNGNGTGGGNGIGDGGGNGGGSGIGGDNGTGEGNEIGDGGNGIGDGAGGTGQGAGGDGGNGIGDGAGGQGISGGGPEGAAAASGDEEDGAASASDALRAKKSSGMPLSGKMSAAKAEMARLGVRNAVSRLEADTDYVNHEIIYPTENAAEAERVAAAYDGIVDSWSDGVAVIKMAADTIDAIEKAEDVKNDFPAVYPNLIYVLDSVEYTDEEINAAKEGLGEDGDAGAGSGTGGNAGAGNGSAGNTGTGSGSKGNIGAGNDSKGNTGTGNGPVGAGNSPAGDAGGSLKEDAHKGAYIDEGFAGEGYPEGTDPADVETVFDRGEASEGDIAAFDALQAQSLVDDADLAASGAGVGAFASAPNDKYAPLQWHQNSIGTYDAWGRTKGKDVKVAIIDSGICATHPDLKNNIIGAYATAGHAFNKGSDNYGHGTHVAGIIAAQAGNKIGVAGVAPQAKIISIKAIDMMWSGNSLVCSGSSADVARAVNLAVEKGAQVINMSLGQNYDDPVMKQAIKDALGQGVVIVAAAGNEGLDLSLKNKDNVLVNKVYPAMYPGVICVSAANIYGGKASYSNFGKDILTIAAPGGEGSSTNGVASTYKGDSYAWMSGTSMAAPVVTGVVALLLGQNTAYKNGKDINTVNYITGYLTETADCGSPYSDCANFGAGLVDARAATAALANTAVAAPVFSHKGEQLKAGSTVVTTNAAGTATIEISSADPGAAYYYTLDGKAPTLASAKGNAFEIGANGKTKITLKAAACVNGKLSKVTTVELKLDARISSISLAAKSGAVTGEGASAEFAVGTGKKLAIVPAFTPSKPANKTLQWVSSDTSIATVDKNGVVTGKAEGLVGIMARSEPSSVGEVVAVRVYPAAASVSMAPAKATLSTQEGYVYSGAPAPTSIDLLAAVNPAGAFGLLSYTSSNPKVASVDADGKVTAVASGKATVTATATDGSGKKAACAVTVIKPARIASVTCAEGQPAGAPPAAGFAVAKGKSINLKAVLEDKKATKTGVTWTVDDKGIAKVSAGKVTGVAEGETFITLRTSDGNHEMRIDISVKPATAGLAADKASETLKVNIPGQDKCAWKVTNKTDGAYGGSYLYTVSNKKIVSVTDRGAGDITINALAKGSATVTAKAADGSGKTVKIAVTVKKMVTDIILSPAPTEGIAYKKSMKFKATVVPADASNTKLIWAVDNPGYFKVDANGNVTVTKKPYYDEYTRVSVTSADGNVSTSRYFNDGAGTAKLGSATEVYAYGDPLAEVKFGYRNNVGKTYSTASLIEGQGTNDIVPYIMYYGDDIYGYIEITSTDDRIAEFFWHDGYWWLYANAPGTATITIRALDGSGKTAKLKVTVKPRTKSVG